MPTSTGYTRSPRLQTGALIQLNREIIGYSPIITLFQYNPETINRTFEIDHGRGRDYKGFDHPTSQVYPPDETFSFTLELDATDDLADGRLITRAVGIAERLASLERLIFSSSGLLGDLLDSVASFFDERITQRDSVPLVLLALGRRRVVPVYVTSLSITETAHNPDLMPIHAEVNLTFRVISDEELAKASGADVELAKAVYRLYRLYRNSLALANNVTAGRDQLKALGVIE